MSMRETSVIDCRDCPPIIRRTSTVRVLGTKYSVYIVLVPYNAAPSTGFEVVSGNTTPEAGEEAPMF